MCILQLLAVFQHDLHIHETSENHRIFDQSEMFFVRFMSDRYKNVFHHIHSNWKTKDQQNMFRCALEKSTSFKTEYNLFTSSTKHLVGPC